MDQPFNARLQFDESSVIGEIDNLALHAGAGRILMAHQGPRIRLKLFVTQRNAFLLPVVFEDLDG